MNTLFDSVEVLDTKKEIQKDELDKIQSPYTIERKNKILIPQITIYILASIVIILLAYVIYNLIKGDKPKDSTIITMNSVSYEVIKWIYLIKKHSQE